MAKNTHAQEVATGTSDSYTEEEAQDPHPPVVITRAMLGEVDRPLPTQDGMDSSQSSESDELPSKFESQDPQSLAQTMANPSNEEGEESSTVDSTGGAGQAQETSQSADGEEEELVDSYDKWLLSELQDECRARGLTVSGTKAELVTRLLTNDSDNANPDEFE